MKISWWGREKSPLLTVMKKTGSQVNQIYFLSCCKQVIIKIRSHQCLSDQNQSQILSRSSPYPSCLDPRNNRTYCESWNPGAGIYLGPHESPRISDSQAIPLFRTSIWTWIWARPGQIRTWYHLSDFQHLAQEDWVVSTGSCYRAASFWNGTWQLSVLA